MHSYDTICFWPALFMMQEQPCCACPNPAGSIVLTYSAENATLVMLHVLHILCLLLDLLLLLTRRRSNPAEYATFLGEDFAYYVLGMAQDGTWGDEVRCVVFVICMLAGQCAGSLNAGVPAPSSQHYNCCVCSQSPPLLLLPPRPLLLELLPCSSRCGRSVTALVWRCMW
jgi:hypothetical protein